ncbi:MAG: four helix bundle protein [Patescibacteria group bacterium]|jgi:four helix bundle protein
MNDKNKIFDLEERTANFGEDVIEFCQNCKINIITKPIISQIIRSSTSIGANYMEANGASSKKDFRNKIHFCKKEAQETKHWLRMMIKADSESKDISTKLWTEAQELTLIFGKIAGSSK